jgi:hypothetical protein
LPLATRVTVLGVVLAGTGQPPPLMSSNAIVAVANGAPETWLKAIFVDEPTGRLEGA